MSPCNKNQDDLLMSICVVFSLMLNDPFKSFNPIEEDGRQIVQGEPVPYPVNSGQNFFNWLKHPILDRLLQQSK
jgi:hypothetical protein